MTAAGSLSPAWAIALAVQKNKDRTKIGLAALKPDDYEVLSFLRRFDLGPSPALGCCNLGAGFG